MRLVLALSLAIVLCGDVEVNPGPSIEEVLKELRDFKTTTDDRLNTIKSDVSNLKTDLSNVKRDLDRTRKQTIADNDNIYDECQGQLWSVGSRIERLERKVEDHERYSRRDNLLFHDIPKEDGETPEQTKAKLLTVLNENVDGKEWSTDNHFVRVHRLKTKSQNPPIIARFIKSDDKFRVLTAKQQLKDKGVGVSTDLTFNQREELRRCKLEGKDAYFKNGRLIVNPRPSNVADSRSGRTDQGRQGQNFRFGHGRGRGGFPSLGFPNRDRGDRRQTDRDRSRSASDIPNDIR